MLAQVGQQLPRRRRDVTDAEAARMFLSRFDRRENVGPPSSCQSPPARATRPSLQAASSSASDVTLRVFHKALIFFGPMPWRSKSSESVGGNSAFSAS